jgi:NTE family protein
LRAYGVFEGGGAKGYAHIGALRAAERHGVKFDAVAGTSAGAIVAAFVAAGFTSDELFLIDADKNRSGAFAINTFELLSLSDWNEWQRLQVAVSPKPKSKKKQTYSPLFAGAFVAYVGWRHQKIFKRFLDKFGNTSADPLKNFLDTQLSAKLGLKGGERARFRDLSRPLRVVASNLATGKMQVLSEQENPDMFVSDAVAASACYPIFFQPVRIAEEPHVDGGIVSNHPAWAFDDLRERDDFRTATIGFRFLDAAATQSSPISSFPAYLAQLLKTALFGASALEIREVRNYYFCDIVPGINTLDFQQLHSLAPEIVEQGQESAAKFLERSIGLRDPEFMERILSAIRSEVRKKLGTRDLRAYIVDRHSPTLFRVLYSAGLRLEAERRALIHRDVVGVATAFIEKEPVHIDLEKMPSSERQKNGVLVSDGGSLYAIPILRSFSHWSFDPAHRDEPEAMLVFESSDSFKKFLLSPDLEDYFATISDYISEYLAQRSRGEEPPAIKESGAVWAAVAGKAYIVKSTRKHRNRSNDADLVDLDRSITKLADAY